jgi:hypothetical protein
VCRDMEQDLFLPGDEYRSINLRGASDVHRWAFWLVGKTTWARIIKHFLLHKKYPGNGVFAFSCYCLCASVMSVCGTTPF